MTIFNLLLITFAITITTAQTNHSLSFDYMSGYAISSLTSNEIFGDNYTFTVESWYKNDGVDSGNNQGYDDGVAIVTNYKRSGGGDPYNNFHLTMVPENHGDIGTFNMQGAGSVERYDDGQWHHVVGIIEKTSENSATSILYVDGEFISQYELGESDFISSSNKIYINNHSPFAGDHMQDCSVAGIRVSSGKRYSENFSPEFPLSTDGETIFNLDFSSGDGSTLGDLSSNGHNFAIQGNASWNTDVPVLGCTDPYAENYNENASVDDGSCSGYPEFLTEVEHLNEPRSFANNLIKYNNEFLVSLGDRRIKRIDSDGNVADLFVQLDGSGDLTTIIPFDNYIIAHGGASGYNLNNFIIDASLGSYNTQNLSAGSGYSSAGDIIEYNGDIYMAWASNCCGMGQTWDTELKKLNGLSTDVVWNTEICFSCDQSLGGGSAGLDYPRDLEIIGENLIVVGEKVSIPDTPNPYIVSVDLNGEINWTSTEEDYVGLYKKSIETNNFDILAAGDGNGFFITRYNVDGEKIWRTEINSIPEDAILTDFIKYDQYALLYGVSNLGVHVTLVDQISGDIFINKLYETNNDPLIYNASTQSQLIEMDNGQFLAIYNHGEWWDDTNFSIVTFDLNLNQDEEEQEYSLSFDGDDDYVSTTIDYNQILGATDITVNASVKYVAADVDGGPSGQGIFSNGESGNAGHQIEFGIFDWNNGNPQFLVSWASTLNETPNMEHAWLDYQNVIAGQWYNISFLLSNNTLLWYLDDVLVETDQVNFSSLGYYKETEVPTLNIGQANRTYDTFFNGFINNLTLSINGETLADWNFNEGEGTTITDISGNDNHGTINGATWSTDVPFEEETEEAAELTWSVQVSASQGDLTDLYNYLGVSADGTNYFDNSLDELEPPTSPGSRVDVSFPHPEWDNLLGDDFSSDIRPEVVLTDSMQVWDFVVSGTDAGTVELVFDFTDTPDVPIILERVSTEVRTHLVDGDRYSFTIEADEEVDFTISIGDVTSPDVMIASFPNGPAVYLAGGTRNITWEAEDAYDYDSSFVYSSVDSGETFELVASLGSESSYEWTIPEVDDGVLYGGFIQVEVRDYAGNSSTVMNNRPFAMAGDSLVTEISAGWTLWGSPVVPAIDSMHLNLGDDFDGYWSTFDYVNNGYTYDGFLYQSEGYWLASLEDTEIDILGSISDEDVTMDLVAGWELISNPLVLDVSIDSLVFDNGSELKEYGDAVSAGWVNIVYGYADGSYQEVTVLKPWHGYWLAVLEEGLTMTFPIHNTPEEEEEGHSREDLWAINFQASTEGAIDNMLTIGYHENATDGFDVNYDVFSPPLSPAEDQVSLTISHPEWNQQIGNEYTMDIRSMIPGGSFKEWNVNVNTTSETINVTWDFYGVPNEYEVGYSTNGGIFFEDMRRNEAMTLSSDMELIIRVGTQVLGVDAPSVPQTFTLEQNYPNPFNPTTQIKYALPEDALVSISIYDVTGRMVKSLVNTSKDAGYHSLRWDATNNSGEAVSAGMYIYTIQAGQYRATKKMVLLK